MYAKLGLIPQDVASSDGFKATKRVFEEMGLDKIDFDRKTAMTYEQ